ncbi:MAG: ATP-binding protein [Polyangiales bacterium]
MLVPALPPDEAERVARLRQLAQLDAPPDARVDQLLRVIRGVFDIPIALVSLVDHDRQWFRGRSGLDIAETSREVSFCGHAILAQGAFVVEDAAADPRFHDNPLVTGDPCVRFYAGVPLLGGVGRAGVGTLCLFDRRPRSFSDEDAQRLTGFAEHVEALLRLLRVEAAWDAAPLAATVTDDDGRLLLANRAFGELCGRPLATLLGRRLEDPMHPIDRWMLREMLHDAVREGRRPPRRELRFRRPKGELVSAGTSVAPLPQGPGLSVCVLRDLSQERNVDAAEEVLGEVLRELKRPLDTVRGAVLALASATPQTQGVGALARRELDQLESLLDARLGDIGARLKAEALRAESEQRFRAVVEHLADPVLVIDPHGDILDANHAALRDLPRHAAGAVGHNLADLYPDLKLEDIAAAVRPAMQGRDAAQTRRMWASGEDPRHAPTNAAPIVAKLRRADGTDYEAEVRAVPLSWEGPPRTLVVARDLTPQREAERVLRDHADSLEAAVQRRTQELAAALDRAEAATRSKSAFLAMMSHEIRTPLSALLGFFHLLEGTGPNPRQQALLRDAERAARRLLGIINDILDFSKVEANAMTLERAPFELSAVIAEVRAAVTPTAHAKGIGVWVTLPSEVPRRLVGDAMRLYQVLLNLVGNAVKFTEHGGVRIAVRAVRVDDEATLEFSVSDTGIGITEAQRQHLLEPFRQAEDSTARRFGGTGLGLAICDRLVRLMGGSLAVRSEPGRGSVFSFTTRFGRFDEDDEEVDAPIASAPPSLEGALVLVVEDDPFNQMVITEMVRGFGATVRAASDGAEALRSIRAWPVDVVVMDVQMPAMDGLETTRRLRADATLPQPPVLGLSANAFDEDRASAHDAGMNDFLPKPVEPRVLHARLARLLLRESAPPAPALDPRYLAEQLGLDEAGVARFALRYLHTLRAATEELTGSAERGDLTALAAVAHRLKSSSAMVGATQLSALCRALESAAQRGERVAAVAQAPTVLREIARVRHEAEALVAAQEARRAAGSP